MCRSINLTSLINSVVNIQIRNFEQLFSTQTKQDDCEHNVSVLVLRYHQREFIHSIFVWLQSGHLYHGQWYNIRPSVQHQGIDCKIDYTNINEGIMSEYHHIEVKYIESEMNDLDCSYHGQDSSVLGSYSSCTPANQIFQCLEPLLSGKIIVICITKCNMPPQWVSGVLAQVYVVDIKQK